MTVSITDCTPKGKSLSSCTPADLLRTIEAINSWGMLRMHAQDRLTNQVIEEAKLRGLGLYTYPDRDKTPWEREVGVTSSLAKGGEKLADEDYHECIACDNNDYDLFHVFPVHGSLNKTIKAAIKAQWSEKVAKAEADHVKWLAKQPKESQTHCCTGICLW